MTEFFMPMIPPTATAQRKQVRVANGKHLFYAPDGLQQAQAKLMAHLAKHRPQSPIIAPVRVIVKWCYPAKGQLDGTYRTTRPDLDNLAKGLMDCMTKVGFWPDDALVASLVLEKFWATTPGIYIRIEQLEAP